MLCHIHIHFLLYVCRVAAIKSTNQVQNLSTSCIYMYTFKVWNILGKENMGITMSKSHTTRWWFKPISRSPRNYHSRPPSPGTYHWLINNWITDYMIPICLYTKFLYNRASFRLAFLHFYCKNNLISIHQGEPFFNVNMAKWQIVAANMNHTETHWI